MASHLELSLGSGGQLEPVRRSPEDGSILLSLFAHITRGARSGPDSKMGVKTTGAAGVTVRAAAGRAHPGPIVEVLSA